MNKKLWIGYNSDLPCPNCNEGVLQDYKKDVLSETLKSLENNEYHRNGIVYPETTLLGTGHLKCLKCKDVVLTTYILKEDVRYTDEEGYEHNFVTPLFYYPSPHIIHIPPSCPMELKNVLLQSFGLYWIDLGSCANKIRVFIEILLKHLRIEEKGSLHTRIEKLSAINLNVSNYLLAIKWIGNSGSHYSTVTKEAILDAYELLEYSLEVLFNDREQKLNELSSRINKAKKHE